MESLRLEGVLPIDMVNLIQAKEKMLALLKENGKNIFISLANVENLKHLDVAFLLASYKTAAKQEKKLHLEQVPLSLKNLLDEIQFHRLFEIHYQQ